MKKLAKIVEEELKKLEDAPKVSEKELLEKIKKGFEKKYKGKSEKKGAKALVKALLNQKNQQPPSKTEGLPRPKIDDENRLLGKDISPLWAGGTADENMKKITSIVGSAYDRMQLTVDEIANLEDTLEQKDKSLKESGVVERALVTRIEKLEEQLHPDVTKHKGSSNLFEAEREEIVTKLVQQYALTKDLTAAVRIMLKFKIQEIDAMHQSKIRAEAGLGEGFLKNLLRSRPRVKKELIIPSVPPKRGFYSLNIVDPILKAKIEKIIEIRRKIHR